MSARRVALAALAALATSACALLGYDLGDYGGASADGGSPGPIDGASEGSTGDDDGSSTDGAGGDGGGGGDGSAPDGGPDDASSQPDAPCTVGANYKRVFVTTDVYPADGIGGIQEANGYCIGVAAAAGIIQGTFAAWISTDGVTATDHLTFANVPYVLVDGKTIVACSGAELLSGHLRHPIDRTEENGFYQRTTQCGAGATGVWTGTLPDGGTSRQTCRSWTANDAGATLGDPHVVDGGWTQACTGVSCGGQGSLYCIEQ